VRIKRESGERVLRKGRQLLGLALKKRKGLIRKGNRWEVEEEKPQGRKPSEKRGQPWAEKGVISQVVLAKKGRVEKKAPRKGERNSLSSHDHLCSTKGEQERREEKKEGVAERKRGLSNMYSDRLRKTKGGEKRKKRGGVNLYISIPKRPSGCS